uniref:Uncharacterized protein n=1 Tax=Magallana gigas TaxID=29159 RepID=A0A8W8HX48_MAGGI
MAEIHSIPTSYSQASALQRNSPKKIYKELHGLLHFLVDIPSTIKGQDIFKSTTTSVSTPPSPTEMDTEQGDSDDIGRQTETFNADPSSTELYIPPSPARSTLYATATHTISPAGALTTTMPTSLQPVMITLPTPGSLQPTIPSSSQQIPLQHHSLQEHQIALTGQHTYIPPAPATYQPLVPVQVPLSLGLVDITQQYTESVDQYISRIRKLSTDSIVPDDCLTTMIMKGLETAIRNIVMPQFPQTIDDLRTKSAIAEMTVLMNNQSLSTETSDNSVVNAMSAVCDVTNQLQQTIAAMRTNPPNNVPYHEDTADHPAPGYSRYDFRQANRYRGPPPQQSHPT